MTSPRSFYLYYLIAGAALLATAIVHAEPAPSTDAAPWGAKILGIWRQ